VLFRVAAGEQVLEALLEVAAGEERDARPPLRGQRPVGIDPRLGKACAMERDLCGSMAQQMAA
jgi:hypothetical protein